MCTSWKTYSPTIPFSFTLLSQLQKFKTGTLLVSYINWSFSAETSSSSYVCAQQWAKGFLWAPLFLCFGPTNRVLSHSLVTNSSWGHLFGNSFCVYLDTVFCLTSQCFDHVQSVMKYQPNHLPLLSSSPPCSSRFIPLCGLTSFTTAIYGRQFGDVIIYDFNPRDILMVLK